MKNAQSLSPRKIFPRKRKKNHAQTLSQTRRDERLLLRVFFDAFLFLRVDEMRTKFPGASFFWVGCVSSFLFFLLIHRMKREKKPQKSIVCVFRGRSPSSLFPALSSSFVSLSLSLSLFR